MTSAAFFDLDNTLIRGSSMFHLARGLRHYRFLTDDDVRAFVWQNFKFVLIGKEHIGDMQAIKANALRLAKGHSYARLVEVSEPVINEFLLPKVFERTLAIAREHLARGEQVWIVTASPQQLAGILAEKLGLTGALGTVAEIVDGEFTGELEGPILHGAEKAVAITKLAAERGIDLSRSTAYSDSMNDEPMLSAVGHAVAVNADRRLRALARRSGWDSVDFRRSRLARKYSLHAGLVALLTAVAGLARGRRRRP